MSQPRPNPNPSPERAELSLEDRALLEGSRQDWFEKFMAGLFGERPERGSGARATDRLELERHAGFQRNKGMVQIEAEQLCDQLRTAFAEQLAGCEEVRKQARDDLERLSGALPAFAATIAAPYKEHGVLQERGILEVRNFIHELTRLNASELLRAIVDNQVFIRMIAELHGTSEGLRGLSPLDPNFEPPNMTPMLALPEHQDQPGRAEANYRLAADLLGRAFSPRKGISPERRIIEANLAGHIVAKLDPGQRKYLFSLFFEREEAGVGEAGRIMVELVRTGVMTRADCLEIIHDQKLQEMYGKLYPPDFDSEIAKADEDWQKASKAMKQAVQSLSGRMEKNPAALSFGQGVVGVGSVLVGVVGVLTNVMANVGQATQGRSGWQALLGVPKGIFNSTLDFHVYASAALVAVGTDVLTGGWPREAALYSDSKAEQEQARKRELAKYVISKISSRPGLRYYFLFSGEGGEDGEEGGGRYDDLRARAEVNRATLGAYNLRDADLPITDRDIERCGFSVPRNPEARKNLERKIRSDLRDVFLVTSAELDIRNTKALDRFFNNPDSIA